MPEAVRHVSPRLEELCGMTDARLWGETLALDLELYTPRRSPGRRWLGACCCTGCPAPARPSSPKRWPRRCKVPLVATSYSVWQRSKEGHLGDVLKAMDDDFKLAKKHAPCILFIDEIEAVGSRESGGSNQRWYTNVVTALNEQLDGIMSREGVVVIAATNYPDRVDAALQRPGRLDARIAIPTPCEADLRGILRFHLGKDLPDADLGGLAVALVGSTGADVEKLVRDARRRARQPVRPLLLEDLFAALGGGLADLEPAYLERIAIHEAGHAVAAVVLEVSRNVSISLYQRGESSAATFFETAGRGRHAQSRGATGLPSRWPAGRPSRSSWARSRPGPAAPTPPTSPWPTRWRSGPSPAGGSRTWTSRYGCLVDPSRSCRTIPPSLRKPMPCWGRATPARSTSCANTQSRCKPSRVPCWSAARWPTRTSSP